MSQEKRRSIITERGITIARLPKANNAVKLKLVCVRVKDPKNVDSKTEYTVVRVPRHVAIDLIHEFGRNRVSFVPKRTYKQFIKTVQGGDKKGPSTTTGITQQEIRHCGIIKKEIDQFNKLKLNDPNRKKGFNYPAYNDDSQTMLASDEKEFERQQKVDAGVHDRGNNRKRNTGKGKRSSSRRRNISGSYVFGGFRVHANNGTYKDVAKVAAIRSTLRKGKNGIIDEIKKGEPIDIEPKD